MERSSIAFMWQGACSAVFVSLFRVTIVSSARFSQRIERAVAEKAVKVLWRDARMAGEVRALRMREEWIPVFCALCHAPILSRCSYVVKTCTSCACILAML